jgi:hypothetical protein
LSIANCQFGKRNRQSKIGNRQLVSLRLFVTCVLAATTAELAEFQPIRRSLLILRRHVVPTFAILALKHNVIAWHFFISNFRLPIANFFYSRIAFSIGNRQLAIDNVFIQ